MRSHPANSPPAAARIVVLTVVADGDINDAEVEWLELKAACYPTGGVFKSSENEADYQWHVAKAVVALAKFAGLNVPIRGGISDTALVAIACLMAR